LDSGATRHLCSKRSAFVTYQRLTVPVKVFVADGTCIDALGVGNIRLLVGGTHILLQNALFVPGISQNLLSISQLDSKGMAVTFRNNVCSVSTPDGTELFSSKKVGNCYRISGSTKEEAFAIGTGMKTYIQAHEALGHVSFSTIKTLVDMGAISNVDITSVIPDTCEVCLKGKMTRKVQPKLGAVSTTQLNEMLHGDLVGPFEVKTKSGYQYAFNLVEDSTGENLVLLLRRKSDALPVFRDLFQTIRTQHGVLVKVLRTDNGGEFVSGSFKKFCNSQGILQQFTVPYTPAQNGRAERTNRTLVEMTRCLLSQADLPKQYWGDAIVHSAYIRNRLPSSRLGGDSPYYRKHGVQPVLDNLIPFGVTVWYHVGKQNRKKLDDKAVQGKFLGFAADTKDGLRILASTGKVVVSKDVHWRFGSSGSGLPAGSSGGLGSDSSFSPGYLGGSDSTVDSIIGLDFSDSDSSDADVIVTKPVKEARKVEEKTPILTSTSASHQGGVVTETISDVFHIPCDIETPLPIIGDDNPFYVYKELDSDVEQARKKVEDAHGMVDQRNIVEGAPTRTTRTMGMLAEYAYRSDDTEVSWKKALDGPEREQWLAAMNEELNSIKRHNTWKVVTKPTGVRTLPTIWVLTKKRNELGVVIRYKARLVVLGNLQLFGRDYGDVFAPIAKFSTLQFLLAIATQRKMVVKQMDVITSFLNAKMDRDVYISAPAGFERMLKSDECLLLLQALYGMKQSPRLWNKEFDSKMRSFGFVPTEVDAALYVKVSTDGSVTYPLIFVDDMVIAADKLEDFLALKENLSQFYEMKDLGDLRFILGMVWERSGSGESLLHQRQYCLDIIMKFGMDQSKAVATPADVVLDPSETSDLFDNVKLYQEAVGSLIYLMTGTRPDIAYSVGVVSRYMHKPTKVHWLMVKRILRYLKGTADFGIVSADNTLALTGYADANWGSDLETRRSTTGYLFMVHGSLVSWCSKRQATVALSSAEAEYMSVSSAAQEAIWLRELSNVFGMSTTGPTIIYQDNQGTIAMARNPGYHGRTKHIDIRYHFVRERVADGSLDLEYLSTDQMLADILTKPLPHVKFLALRSLLGMGVATVVESRGSVEVATTSSRHNDDMNTSNK
jgi:hypothetical protein